MPHDVFLSYASADRAAADAVCAALEARGIRCWIAPRNVPAGADWGEAILTAIGRAHAMVLILSRNTAGSVHVRNEVVTAVSQSLALVPVRIEDCQPGGALRLHLAGSHWLNVFPPPVEQHADELAAGVRLALAADATIELPRAQAAALVAAARAASGGRAAPVAAPRSAGVASSPAPRPAPPRPTPAPARRPPATADPAPHLPRPGRGHGAVLIVLAVLLLAALGVAAWMFEPRLRAMFGAARNPRPALVAAGPPAEAAPPAQPALATIIPSPGLPPLAAPGSEPRIAPLPAPEPSAQPASPAEAAPPRSFGAAGPSPISPAPAPAATRLMNLASETISRLYVAREEEGIGQEDWLGHAQITPGNAVLLRPPPGQGCAFNIRVVYVGGRTEDRPGVDLCAAPELRFEGSKSAGASSSR